jgi:hypothetical protein
MGFGDGMVRVGGAGVACVHVSACTQVASVQPFNAVATGRLVGYRLDRSSDGT